MDFPVISSNTSFLRYTSKTEVTLFYIVTLVLFSLQDVSDCIEKEPDESELLVSLQKDSIPVVRGDWKVHLSSELQEGE